MLVMHEMSHRALAKCGSTVLGHHHEIMERAVVDKVPTQCASRAQDTGQGS